MRFPVSVVVVAVVSCGCLLFVAACSSAQVRSAPTSAVQAQTQAGGAGGTSDDGPRLEVRPDRPLADGEEIVLEASGFGPDETIGAGLCLSTAVGTDSEIAGVPVDLSRCSNEIQLGGTDSQGTGRFDFTVRSNLDTSAGVFDCTAADQTCVAGVVALDEPEPLVVPLEFAGPSVTYSPELQVGRVERADPRLVGPVPAYTVEFRLVDAAPGSTTEVRWCLGMDDGWDPGNCSDLFLRVQVDPDGAASGTLLLGQIVTDAGSFVDCSEPSRPCVLVAGAFTDSPAVAAIAMAASTTG